MNIILAIISIVVCFSTVVLLEKKMGKEGLYVWIAIANICANIAVCKSVDIAGMAFALGNVLFASNFLAMDILNEKYGLKESKKGVNVALISVICFLVITQGIILFVPNATDTVHSSIVQLFSINLRTSIASIIMLYVANILAVKIYDKLKKKGVKLWVRNNVTTIICNCLENYIFTFLAFAGIYDIKTILIIATTGSIAEIIIALCDTPFVYWARREMNENRSNKLSARK